MKTFRTVVATLLVAASFASQAALVDSGTYVTDTNTGLSWLHNTSLAGQSYNSVLAGYGGYAEGGWRYATGVEIKQLITSYVGPLSPLNAQNGYSAFIYGTAAYNSAYRLIELLGINVSFGMPPDPRSTSIAWNTSLTGIATQGWYDDLGGDPAKVGLMDLTAYIWDDGSIYAMTQIIPDFVSPNWVFGRNVSAILVRDGVAQVPEPSTIFLLLSALFFSGAILFRARRAARLISPQSVVDVV